MNPMKRIYVEEIYYDSRNIPHTKNGHGRYVKDLVNLKNYEKLDDSVINIMICEDRIIQIAGYSDEKGAYCDVY